MRDELPKRINPVECVIVNLSPHEQLGSHWVCYAKVHETRIYFDSFRPFDTVGITKVHENCLRIQKQYSYPQTTRYPDGTS